MYIAVELKVIEGVASAAARSCAASEDRILAGLVRLWHRCWTQTTDTVTLGQLAGVMGGEGLPEVAAALVEHGFLEAKEGAFRVRGATRYLRLKASRVEGAKKTNEARSKSVGGKRSRASVSDAGATQNDALPPSTEHRAPSTESEKTAPASRSRPEKATDPRHAPLVEALCSIWKQRRLERYPFQPRDAKAVKDMLSHSEPSLIESAWVKALNHQGFPNVSTIPELQRHFAHFVGERGASRDNVGTFTTNSVTEGF